MSVSKDLTNRWTDGFYILENLHMSPGMNFYFDLSHGMVLGYFTISNTKIPDARGASVSIIKYVNLGVDFIQFIFVHYMSLYILAK